MVKLHHFREYFPLKAKKQRKFSIMALIIDPPQGWKYGFPKPIPDDRRYDPIPWLIEQGYPQELVDEFRDRFFCRYWEEPNEINEIKKQKQ